MQVSSLVLAGATCNAPSSMIAVAMSTRDAVHNSYSWRMAQPCHFAPTSTFLASQLRPSSPKNKTSLRTIALPSTPVHIATCNCFVLAVTLAGSVSPDGACAALKLPALLTTSHRNVRSSDAREGLGRGVQLDGSALSMASLAQVHVAQPPWRRLSGARHVGGGAEWIHFAYV
eukprot:scaffold106_cov380-Prasinococcus_capsulatus_cf.AAC.67